MLLDWDQRPQEVANLLNPPFDGFLLHQAIATFEQESDLGMPFEMTFLVLPFVLHEATRNRLPTRSTTHLASWLLAERDLLMGFAERTTDLVPYTREAILFLAARRLISIDQDGRCRIGDAKLKRGVASYWRSHEEVARYYKAASLVGRWLASSGNSTTLFALLGITP